MLLRLGGWFRFKDERINAKTVDRKANSNQTFFFEDNIERKAFVLVDEKCLKWEEKVENKGFKKWHETCRCRGESS